jgi:hypothetical protein
MSVSWTTRHALHRPRPQSARYEQDRQGIRLCAILVPGPHDGEHALTRAGDVRHYEGRWRRQANRLKGATRAILSLGQGTAVPVARPVRPLVLR